MIVLGSEVWWKRENGVTINLFRVLGTISKTMAPSEGTSRILEMSSDTNSNTRSDRANTSVFEDLAGIVPRTKISSETMIYTNEHLLMN